MPRLPNVSMKATNQLLDYLAQSFSPGAVLEAEAVLAERFEVGRAAIRSVLIHLETIGVLGRAGRSRQVLRVPRRSDFYALQQTESRTELVQRRFLDLALSGGLLPGQYFREAEVARNFGASTVSVREFLISYSRFGLVEKTARGGWRFCAFDMRFALELAAIRKMFEVSALQEIEQLPPDHEIWDHLRDLLRRHQDMLGGSEEQVRQFSVLDRELHALITGQLKNRFVEDLFDVVSFVFHYHYQWRRDDQIQRNRFALEEHIRILNALLDRDFQAATQLLQTHLATSVRTLLESAIPVAKS